MLIIKSRKRRIIGGIERSRIKTPGERENYKYLGILEVDIMNQVEIKEKIRKEYLKLLETKLCSRKLSHQRNKHLGIPLCKILETILKRSKGRTQWKGPEDKKADDDAQGLISERWHRLYVSRKEGRRWFFSIEDCVYMNQYNDSRMTLKRANKTNYSSQ